MTNAVAYYRVSTPRQGESGLGLAAQKRMVRNYCMLNKIKLVREFREVKSGENDKRPKVQAAIKLCRQKDYLLIVAKQSRLARSVLFIAALINSKFNFISVDMPTANKLQKHIQAAFDEHYLDEISNNTKQSLQAARKRGIKLGGNSKKMKRTIRRQYKAFLRRIRPIIRGIQKRGTRTVRGITDELNRRKIITRRGNKGGWHVSVVHKILHDL